MGTIGLTEDQRPSRRSGRSRKPCLDALLPLALLATPACSWFDGLSLGKSLIDQSNDGAVTDANGGVGTGVRDSRVPGGTCVSARPPPPRPGVSSAAGDSEFVVAFRTEDVGSSDDSNGVPRFLKIGYDLDQTCTGNGAGPSCAEPSWATADHTDGQDGRDNAVGRLLYEVRPEGGMDADIGQNADINDGTLTALVRVSGYNGSSNDDRVRVDMFGATLNEVNAPDAGRSPTWDGADEWFAYADWVARPDGGVPAPEILAQYSDTSAYVTDGILVAHFPQVPLGPVLITFDVWVTARVTMSDSRWALREGTLAGRMPIDSVLAAATFDSKPQLCANDPKYPMLQKLACSIADIRTTTESNPSDGTTGSDSECNAASLAFLFTADPARLVGTTEKPFPTGACDTDVAPGINSRCSDL